MSINEDASRKWRVYAVAPLGDERGSLIALEGGDNVPFAIARVYYLYGTQLGVSRGFHAHLALNQLAIVVRGSCTMVLDDGAETTEVSLDRPDKALFMGPMVWHEMRDFSEDCVLLVLADAVYDETDYIRDHDRFLSLTRA